MDDKTSKDDFGKATNPQEPEVKIDYSREDLTKRMELQEKLAKHGGDMKFIADIRKEYQDKQDKNYANSGVRDFLFDNLKSKGYHRETTHEDLDRNREMEDQNFRNKLMDRMGKYYKDNQSIGKDFEKAVDKDPPIGKG
jgi:hypothetical protein